VHSPRIGGTIPFVGADVPRQLAIYFLILCARFSSYLRRPGTNEWIGDLSNRDADCPLETGELTLLPARNQLLQAIQFHAGSGKSMPLAGRWVYGTHNMCKTCMHAKQKGAVRPPWPAGKLEREKEERKYVRMNALRRLAKKKF